MNKKLVAIMTFVLITLGATMTVTSHKIEAVSYTHLTLPPILRV